MPRPGKNCCACGPTTCGCLSDKYGSTATVQCTISDNGCNVGNCDQFPQLCAYSSNCSWLSAIGTVTKDWCGSPSNIYVQMNVTIAAGWLGVLGAGPNGYYALPLNGQINCYDGTYIVPRNYSTSLGPYSCLFPDSSCTVSFSP